MEDFMTIEELNKLVLEAKNFKTLKKKIKKLGYVECATFVDELKIVRYRMNIIKYFVECDEKVKKETQEKEIIRKRTENTIIYGELNDKYFKIEEGVKMEDSIFIVNSASFYLVNKNYYSNKKDNNFKEFDVLGIVTNCRNDDGVVFNNSCPILQVEEDYKTEGFLSFDNGKDLKQNESAMCGVSFLTPEVYPKSLSVGDKINIYGYIDFIGVLEITKINNKILER